MALRLSTVLSITFIKRIIMTYCIYKFAHRTAARKAVRVLAALILLSAAGMQAATHNSTDKASGRIAHAAPLRSPADSDLFGMVMRDPFYEYNTDPVNYPNALN